MSVENTSGKKISFECSELIEELKQDIAEFGATTIFAVWVRKIEELQAEIIVNYDFVEGDVPISLDEIQSNEHIIYMQGDLLLEALEKQNSVV